MKDAQPHTIRRQDYRPPEFLISHTALRVELATGGTQVTAQLRVQRNPEGEGGPLVLDGQALELVSVALDDEALSSNRYVLDDESLTIHAVPDAFELELVTQICPEQNTALSGLYRSGSLYCTQCEAEGFRRITYYLDRPDVLARFRTTVVGALQELPVMLSNGNEVARETLADGRVAVTWDDPFPKPCYLFALVAGRLDHIEDRFTTVGGREVTLRIYTEPHNADKVAYAMDVLKRAMRWDEEVYGREYDLDIFMIVAVDDFNMGAMENKGLNIFNTSCVLATPETTTDAGFRRVEAVVAHEYFHNWSGNRVTCRDWFQLSLKEGFTVFRDAQFSAAMNSPTVKRIEDVNFLRTVQFAEDAGPMAHPVRPDSYMEISNFYTPTVYEKGAEVVRMIHTLLGPARFRAGTDLYFARHDGEAVTCDDFVTAMEDACGIDLGQFRGWYAQAGTPQLDVEASYDPQAASCTLRIAQGCPASPGQEARTPLHIPIALGLLSPEGDELLGVAGAEHGHAVHLDDARPEEVPGADGTLVVHLREAVRTLRFANVMAEPRLSFLRDFSAPVKVILERTLDDLAFLAGHDADGFARWDAGQALYTRVLLARVADPQAPIPDVLTALIAALLAEARTAPDDCEARALLAAMLTLPAEDYLGQQLEVVDVDGIHAAREGLRNELARSFAQDWQTVYDSCSTVSVYQPDSTSGARRSLANLALAYLIRLEGSAGLELARIHYMQADNMTDRLSALRTVAWSAHWAASDDLLADFFERYQGDALVVDQWFATQALAPRPDTLEQVRALQTHNAFDARNPNRLRALIGAFSNQNSVCFHAADGAGYAWLADWVLRLDQSNPQVSARLLTPLTHWRRFDAGRQQLMRGALEQIRNEHGLSKDVFEVVAMSLAD